MIDHCNAEHRALTLFLLISAEDVTNVRLIRLGCKKGPISHIFFKLFVSRRKSPGPSPSMDSLSSRLSFFRAMPSKNLISSHRFLLHRRMAITVGAHRGYRKLFPENTILSFDQAVNHGADMIELDLHLSSDQVLVVIHDQSTKAVFGTDYNVCKTSYKDVLSKLRTIRHPPQPMPTFSDVLEWLSDYPDVKLMLDIKRDNPAKDVIRLILEELTKKNTDVNFWRKRIIFGLWSVDYYLLNQELLEGFDVVNIAVDLKKSFQFANTVAAEGGKLHGISFLHLIWYHQKYRTELVKFANSNSLVLYLWTINDPYLVKECGVNLITDDIGMAKKALSGVPVASGPTWRYSVGCYFKAGLFSTVQFLLGRDYNLKYLALAMKKFKLL